MIARFLSVGCCLVLALTALACGAGAELGAGGGGPSGEGGGNSVGGGSASGGGFGGGSAVDAGAGGGSPGLGGGSAGGGKAGSGDAGAQPDAGSRDAGIAGPGKLTIIVEPSDNAAALIAAITGAKSSVHMTMYLLSSMPIINALIAQKNAGHEVEVLLNQNFPGGAGSNQTVYTQLQTAGVNVKWTSSSFTLTHEKTVILDGTTAWIMTMNATTSSPTANREYLAVDTFAADVQEAESIFQSDFNGTSAVDAGSLVVAPINARAALLSEINRAASTIDMEAEELSDSQIVSALVSARGRSVRVRIVLSDSPPSAAQATTVTQLKSAGVVLVSLHKPYIHAKSMVIDGTTAYVGSENFTTNSLIHNRELGLLFSTPSEIQKVLSTTASDFASGTAL